MKPKQKQTQLTVLAIPESGFGDYNYMVHTPENDVMYFADKKKAHSFIEFYKRYTIKKDKVS
jgi:hypothetical protein